MGMARLNVWISGMDDPCSIDDRTWYVTVYDCDGNVLQWGGKKYVVLPAPSGHLEVELPPGCYYLKAVWNFAVLKPGSIYWVNHFTDPAIVQARCDETVCVKLFNPSAHRCGRILIPVIDDLLRQKAIKPDTARKITHALNELLEQLPPPEKEFELGHLDEIERLLKKQKAEGRKRR